MVFLTTWHLKLMLLAQRVIIALASYTYPHTYAHTHTRIIDSSSIDTMILRAFQQVLQLLPLNM